MVAGRGGLPSAAPHPPLPPASTRGPLAVGEAVHVVLVRLPLRGRRGERHDEVQLVVRLERLGKMLGGAAQEPPSRGSRRKIAGSAWLSTESIRTCGSGSEPPGEDPYWGSDIRGAWDASHHLDADTHSHRFDAAAPPKAIPFPEELVRVHGAGLLFWSLLGDRGPGPDFRGPIEAARELRRLTHSAGPVAAGRHAPRSALQTKSGGGVVDRVEQLNAEALAAPPVNRDRPPASRERAEWAERAERAEWVK
eukprot:gene5756-biopygen5812